MKNCVILMTALVPTIGHKALIDFALAFGNRVDVIISGRSIEPTSVADRVAAFEEIYPHYKRHPIFHIHEDDNAPQNPSTPEEWNYWKNVVEEFTDSTYVVASEPYGKKMAELINGTFIPYDIDRLVVDARGTTARKNINFYWEHVLPTFRKYLLTKITLFGQESTGKTTIAKELYREYISSVTMEFARPYLEALDDKTVNHYHMMNIRDGQYALQKTAYKNACGPYVFQDTDLLTTIGYNKIYKGENIPYIDDLFRDTKSDLYIVMNDHVAFEEDDLRYGGKERESTKQFWIDLLEEYNCNYYVLQTNGGVQDVLDELYSVIENAQMEKIGKIINFQRE